LASETTFDGGSDLRVWRASGSAYNGLTFSYTDIPVTAYLAPTYADQPGMPGSVSTDYSFVIGADWRNGMLVTSHHGTLAGDGFTTTKAIIDLFNAPTSGAPTLNQEIDIDPGPGIATYYPAAALDGAGNIGITWMESSASEYISDYVAVHEVAAAPGSYSPPVDVFPGLSSNPYAFRAGDYSSLVIDPSSPAKFWGSSEYSPLNSSSDLWATAVYEFHADITPAQHFYSFNLDAGGTITLTTSTPSDQGGEFQNTLIPQIQLFDGNGNLVATGTVLADGHNEQIVFTNNTGVAATYYVAISAQNQTHGEFYLDKQDPPAQSPSESSSVQLGGPGSQTGGAGNPGILTPGPVSGFSAALGSATAVTIGSGGDDAVALALRALGSRAVGARGALLAALLRVPGDSAYLSHPAVGRDDNASTRPALSSSAVPAPAGAATDGIRQYWTRVADGFFRIAVRDEQAVLEEGWSPEGIPEIEEIPPG
jgi:hypothetical protein